MFMEIKIVKTEQERQDAYYVRKTVFVDEQKVPVELEIDEYEDEAIHLVGYIEDKPVAASRIRFIENKGKLERICVLKEHRGKYLGQQLIEVMEQIIKDRNVIETTLNAQDYAIDLYKKLGYKVVSDEFDDAVIPHVTMEKSLV